MIVQQLTYKLAGQHRIGATGRNRQPHRANGRHTIRWLVLLCGAFSSITVPPHWGWNDDDDAHAIIFPLFEPELSLKSFCGGGAKIGVIRKTIMRRIWNHRLVPRATMTDVKDVFE